MKKIESSIHHTLFCRTVVAASLLLAFGSVFAEQAAPSPDEIRKDLYTPDSRLSMGLGYQSSDNRRFGAYRDLTEQGGYGLLDFNLISRDDATGTWMKLRGKNLGLDGRELRFDHERQGDWSYFIQGNESTRKEPLIVNTGLQGIGSGALTVSAAAAKRDVDFKIDRDLYAIGMRKFIVGGFDIRVNAKQEESKGERMYSRGTFGSPNGFMEFLAEPIDRTTRQWEVVAGYADRKLQLSGGYSGSSYDTGYPVLGISGGGAGFASAPALNAIALPPSNSAHQLHLAGGYNFSDATRSSFKLSRTVAYQNETFDPAFTTRLAGAPSSLNGKMATTLAFADLTMRPADRVNLTGSLRYENRDDQTPEAQYLTASGASTSSAGITGFNKPRQFKQLKGLLEASYQLDDGYRLVGALDREEITRNGSRDKIRIAYRENTYENAERLEIKRSMSETLNGGIALVHSQRGGSDYVRDTYINPEVSNQLAALLWADRSRDKVRLTADWLPAEKWGLQFLADFSNDTYSGRALGPRKGTAQFYSADLTYKINDNWNLTTWMSQEKMYAKQSTLSGTVFWDADIRDTSSALGVGVKGKPRRNLEIGADLSGSYDVAEHELSKVSGPAATAVNSLPGYYYRQTSLKLFADYALQANSGIRFNVNVDRRRNNDWTWQNWTYTDGTTVTNLPSENTTFLGVSYYYRWR